MVRGKCFVVCLHFFVWMRKCCVLSAVCLMVLVGTLGLPLGHQGILPHRAAGRHPKTYTRYGERNSGAEVFCVVRIFSSSTHLFLVGLALHTLVVLFHHFLFSLSIKINYIHYTLWVFFCSLNNSPVVIIVCFCAVSVLDIVHYCDAVLCTRCSALSW